MRVGGLLEAVAVPGQEGLAFAIGIEPGDWETGAYWRPGV